MLRRTFEEFNYKSGLSLLVIASLLFVLIKIVSEAVPPPLYGTALQVSNGKETSESLHFAVLADIQNGWGVFKPIMKEIAGSKDSFAIIVGDIVNENNEYGYRFFFNELAKVRGTTPVYFVPGNKDVYNERNEYSLKNFVKYCGPDHYWFSWGNAAFVVLNDTQTAIIADQFHWLENSLRRIRKKYTHIFVFMHIPPFDPFDPLEGKHLCLRKRHRKRFMRIMENFKVDYVFSGHIHCYFRHVINGVTYVISGGAGAQLKCPDAFYHYIRVTIRNEEIVDTVIKIKKDWWLEITGDIKYNSHRTRSSLRPVLPLMRSKPSSPSSLLIDS